MSKLVAPKGSLVLCKNGHVLCELADDLYLGDMNYSAKFVKWRKMKSPSIGQLEVRCPDCDVLVHVEDQPQFVFRPPKASV